MENHITAVPAIKLTYQDYLRIPDDGLRHEILDGLHVVSPSAGSRHQQVQVRLVVALYRAIEEAGLGQVFTDLDTWLGPNDVVRPDIAVITTAHRERVTETHVRGAPDLLVEILSPGGGDRDRRMKRVRYQAGAVPEYWIVDPVANTVEQYALYGDAYWLLGTATEAIQLAILPEATLDLGAVW